MSNGQTRSERSSGMTWLVVVLVVVLAGGLVTTYLFYENQKKVVNLMQVNALQVQRLDEFGKLSEQVEQFNSRFGDRFGRIHIMQGTDVIVSDIDKIQQQELPGSIDSLINDFKGTAEKVEYLGEKIEKLEKNLGSPQIVKSSDTHSELVLKYLTEEAGLSKEDAMNLMKHTALIWELEPGNNVYNLYLDGIFLTTVTQGSAKNSPLVNQRRVRDATTSYIAELEATIMELTGGDSLKIAK